MNNNNLPNPKTPRIFVAQQFLAHNICIPSCDLTSEQRLHLYDRGFRERPRLAYYIESVSGASFDNNATWRALGRTAAMVKQLKYDVYVEELAYVKKYFEERMKAEG